VPGIDFSNDPLLAGRLHSYIDTQITRLGGANFHEIPINAPLAPVHNNQRDGLHRQTVHRGRVSYEPNSLDGGCPFQAGAATGFVSFPQPMEQDKVRGKPEKFADHYTQATLFFDSQTAVEKAHIVGGFRFELSKLTVPAIRERMVASLVNVSAELAQQVADGLGMKLPKAMPKALDNPTKPEITHSPALSLTALPGDGGIRTRKIAILVADGIDAEEVVMLQNALREAGAVPWLVSFRIGPIKAADGDPLSADGSLENSPAVLFDAMVLPGQEAAVKLLRRDPMVGDFIQNQYRHGKTLLGLGASRSLFETQGVRAKLPDGGADASVLMFEDVKLAIAPFIKAVGLHRHPARES
jgi:catalase